MQTTTVKLYTLPYNNVRTYLAASLFVLGNLACPNFFISYRKAGWFGCQSISSPLSGLINMVGWSGF